MEALRCANGSALTLLSTEVSSGLWLTSDLVVVDECWSLDASVEQALRPTMAARPDAQLWLASTAGSFESTWFRSKVDAGRAHSRLDIGSAAYFEWSAADDQDVSDPDGWPEYMPALGITIMPATVQADLESMPVEEFARAYGNRWQADSGDVGWSVIPKDVWKSARLDD
jgi:phage terminase large subunit-like protein